MQGGEQVTLAPVVLPVALVLRGRRCLVVGGGRVAATKARALLYAEATVRVIAPELDVDLQGLLESNARLSWSPGAYSERDLDGVHLVVVATQDISLREAVFAHAEQRSIWVNSVDDPDRCSFHFAALVRRDPVVISVSTSGRSPALASFLRRKVATCIDPAVGRVAEMLGEARRELHARGRSTEGLPWEELVNDDLVQLVASGREDVARARVRTAVLEDREDR